MSSITRGLFTCFSLFVFLGVAHSQEPTEKEGLSVSAYTNGGIRYLDKIGDLNNSLSSSNSGLPKFDSFINVIQTGIGLGYKKWYFLFLDNNFSTNGSSKFPYVTGSGKGNELRIHWRLIKKGKFQLSPFVGLGGQQLSFFLDVSAVPIDVAIKSGLSGTQHNQGLRLSSNQGVFNTGLLVDWKIASLSKDVDFKIGGNLDYSIVVNNYDFRVNDYATSYNSGSFGGIDVRLSVSVVYTIRSY